MSNTMEEGRTTTPDAWQTDRRSPVSDRRVIIEQVRPQIDGGRFAPKRTPGEAVEVSARIFADGHDVLRAVVRHGPKGSSDASQVTTTEMELVDRGADLWRAGFTVSTLGWHEFTIVAWVDRFETWRRDVRIKAAAGQAVDLELLEGALLVRQAGERLNDDGDEAIDRDWLFLQADLLGDGQSDVDRVGVAVSTELESLMHRHADRPQPTTSGPFPLWVDRERARVGAWYEFFPRSATPDPSRSATFREASTWLPRIADLGFDVVYLPPIHPIGRSFRKGRNNTLTALAGDPGSPWAIGSEAGGHDAVDPALGTVDDFLAFRRAAERLGLEVALDLAWQCSPDHPWVRTHPEWFRHRPDGTIKYAENPPKRYQDIYPLDFTCEPWRELWNALLDVTLLWVERGVRIFRVDNPHTKSLDFWGWLIREVQSRDPGVIFLSEAFTRPAVMHYLAKVGFTQSYTYFTWRNTRDEITDYLLELS
ncbi:MAG: maltotransferase domain-containing protein, partial [Vicinamibacterales bacterium]